MNKIYLFCLFLFSETKCSSNEFACDDGACIEEWRLCDYLQDCVDNEDEAQDFCRKC